MEVVPFIPAISLKNFESIFDVSPRICSITAYDLGYIEILISGMKLNQWFQPVVKACSTICKIIYSWIHNSIDIVASQVQF